MLAGPRDARVEVEAHVRPGWGGRDEVSHADEGHRLQRALGLERVALAVGVGHRDHDRRRGEGHLEGDLVLPLGLAVHLKRRGERMSPRKPSVYSPRAAKA